MRELTDRKRRVWKEIWRLSAELDVLKPEDNRYLEDKERLNDLYLELNELDAEQSIVKYIIDKTIEIAEISAAIFSTVTAYRMFREGMQFEETGTYTSYTLKTIIGKMFKL